MTVPREWVVAGWVESEPLGDPHSIKEPRGHAPI